MNRRPFALTIIGTAAAAIALACGSDTTEPTSGNPPKLVKFTATMTAAAENPALNIPAATGKWDATLDTVTNIFTYDFTYSGLTSNVNNGHIHGPVANATTNGGTTVNFATLAGSTFTGFGTGTSGAGHGQLLLTAATAVTATINGDSLKKLLMNGPPASTTYLMYVNIHTINNGGGEIRGTITRVP
jgi:hypothetical protein